jgi:hypothetical protein
MLPLLSAIQHYLHATLEVAIGYRRWSGMASLPYFLQDTLILWESKLLGLDVLLALETSATRASIGDVVKHVQKVSALSQLPVIYVTEALASYERKRLIEHKVPFIVPGNQLYLPDLGLDLREYFRQRRSSAGEALSPSAQAMLIAALLQPIWEVECQPIEILETLGYSAMTRSRAARELIAAGIAVGSKLGRTQQLKLARSPSETWHHAQPLLRSPVKRTVWAYPADIPASLERRAAGQSALARNTALAPPLRPVYATSQAAWLALKGRAIELPESLPGAEEWQLWAYSPALLRMTDAVDPYSLILSLRDNADERVQLALDDITGQLPW